MSTDYERCINRLRGVIGDVKVRFGPQLCTYCGVLVGVFSRTMKLIHNEKSLQPRSGPKPDSRASEPFVSLPSCSAVPRLGRNRPARINPREFLVIRTNDHQHRVALHREVIVK
jgi:hypothetical protein